MWKLKPGFKSWKRRDLKPRSCISLVEDPEPEPEPDHMTPSSMPITLYHTDVLAPSI